MAHPDALASRSDRRRTEAFLITLVAGLSAVIFYMVIGNAIAPLIQALYKDPNVIYAPSHFNDARQYVFICNQGYDVPYVPLPTLAQSRINWMPVYAILQCGLHKVTGISLIYTGTVISALALGITVLLASWTLLHLGIRAPTLHALVALTPLIGGAWLYLPGAEATYLAVGMGVMWLITLPTFPHTPRGRRDELIATLVGIPLGVIFVLTKPNALAFLLPLLFAFLYLSWKRSQAGGYAFRLWTFTADLIIDQIRPALLVVSRLRPDALSLDLRPIRYVWTPLAIVVGVLLGLAYWLAYTSVLSGVPFYFLNQQLFAWGRAWPPGNLSEMTLYFLQAFRTIGPPWRTNAAWNLAANLTALIPAASPRVPGLIRGMLPLMVLFIVFSGAVHGSDRYILSTALVAIGWGCWIAPTDGRKIWSVLRWIFVLTVAFFTAYLLLYYLLPGGNPAAWGIEDKSWF